MFSSQALFSCLKIWFDPVNLKLYYNQESLVARYIINPVDHAAI